ncbi:ABC transporter ATP-binding protein [candidate division KSB1 bacterium]|nr:ABC transporter ATP-binding protein [candidate division KSB1 bacterium]
MSPIRSNEKPATAVLRVEQLSKSYGERRAVDAVSFEVTTGEIFGFLGPNGAGKTTTINLICSLLKPDSGRIFIDGEELAVDRPQTRRKIGVVPQEIALYEELGAIDNLRFWGGLYGLSGKPLANRIDELLNLTGLADRGLERVKTFSGGMKRRLNMAIGMIHRPPLLLLDEPTVGIDPQARHRMLDVVRQVAQEGTAVLYTTHYLDEAESLCDRVAIIDHGRILAQGTRDELTALVGENRLLFVRGRFDRQVAEAMLVKVQGLDLINFDDNQVVYSLPTDSGTGLFLEQLTRAGVQVENLAIKEPNLDSVFIKLTGRELRD